MKVPFDSIVTFRRPMENRSICPVHSVTRVSSPSHASWSFEHPEISGLEVGPQFHFSETRE